MEQLQQQITTVATQLYSIHSNVQGNKNLTLRPENFLDNKFDKIKEFLQDCDDFFKVSGFKDEREKEFLPLLLAVRAKKTFFRVLDQTLNYDQIKDIPMHKFGPAAKNLVSGNHKYGQEAKCRGRGAAVRDGQSKD